MEKNKEKQETPVVKKCPKKYGSYDVSNSNCEKCGNGFLYQSCTIGKDHAACGGWNDEHGQPHCCEHYKEPVTAKKTE